MASDGEQVGTLYDVLIDANDDELTHLIVNVGPHFPAIGFGAPTLLSVPIDEVDDVDERAVRLRSSALVFEHFPVYADWVSGAAFSRYALPRRGMAILHKANKNRQPSEREIEKNAHVWVNEPNVHIGDVERVLMDDESDKVTSLVVRVGFGFGHLVALPIDYVVDFNDVVIHVQMTAEELEALEPFEEPPEW
jgi:sporulation protein YlmC with PRC-barrel domain